MALEDYQISEALKHVCLTCQIFFRRSNARGTIARFNLQREPATQIITISNPNLMLLSNTLILLSWHHYITELNSKSMMQKGPRL